MRLTARVNIESYEPSYEHGGGKIEAQNRFANEVEIDAMAEPLFYWFVACRSIVMQALCATRSPSKLVCTDSMLNCAVNRWSWTHYGKRICHEQYRTDGLLFLQSRPYWRFNEQEDEELDAKGTGREKGKGLTTWQTASVLGLEY